MGKVQKAAGSEVSTNVVDFSADAGAGFEQMTEQDLKIPFIKIAEGLSPEIEESDPKFIDGLKKGQVFNTVTQSFMDAVDVIPCHYARKENVWKPKGGGLVGSFDPSEGWLGRTTPNHKNQDILENGNEVIVTGQYGVLVNEGDGNWYPAIIAMTKTKLTVGRRWNSQMNNLKVETPSGKITPPMFGTIWTLGTLKKTNDDGTWSIWDPSFKGYIQDAALYNMAKDFRTSLTSGDANVKYENNDEGNKNNDDESF